MPYEPGDAHSFTHKANTDRRDRQWRAVYESSRARGDDEGTAIAKASGVVKKDVAKWKAKRKAQMRKSAAQTPSWKRRNKLPPCKKCGNTTRDQRMGICDRCAFPKHAMELVLEGFMKEAYAADSAYGSPETFSGAPEPVDPSPSGPEIAPASGKKRPLVGALIGGGVGTASGVALADSRLRDVLHKAHRRHAGHTQRAYDAGEAQIKAIQERPKQVESLLEQVKAMPTSTPREMAARTQAIKGVQDLVGRLDGKDLDAGVQAAHARAGRSKAWLDWGERQVASKATKTRLGYGLALGLGGAALGAGLGYLSDRDKHANGDWMEALAKGCTCKVCKAARAAGRSKSAALGPIGLVERGAKRRRLGFALDAKRMDHAVTGRPAVAKRYEGVSQKAFRKALVDEGVAAIQKTAAAKDAVRRFLKNRNTQPKTLEQIIQVRSAMGADAFMRRPRSAGFRRPTVASRYAKASRARSSGGPYTRHERALRGERA